jgi:putative hydrolase of the HAD superfamily
VGANLIDLAHIDTWLFDLDNTLYPPEAEVMALVEDKMAEFVTRHTGLIGDEARALRNRYLSEHGTTLAGLMAHHNIDPYAFLNEVHDVSLDKLEVDEVLNAQIDDLSGRKLVFTNGDERHALRILSRMGMQNLFEDVFHLGDAGLIPKPNTATYQLMITKHKVNPLTTIFFEDSPKNLRPAHNLGMTTVLVGPKALDNQDGFVDYRSHSLKAFLASLK